MINIHVLLILKISILSNVFLLTKVQKLLVIRNINYLFC